MSWISVDDKLPNTNEWVLVYSLDIECCVSACNVAYVDEYGEWWDGDFIVYPSFWVPLPPSPSLQGDRMKEVTIEAVETTRVNDKCRGCMFNHKHNGCMIRDDVLRSFDLGMCGELNIIYKIKGK